MNKEILYNEIYERTKDFGRTQFVREIMRLQRELDKYENPDDLTLMFMYCDEKAKDKLKQLQLELDKYKSIVEELKEDFNPDSWEEKYIFIDDINNKIKELEGDVK